MSFILHVGPVRGNEVKWSHESDIHVAESSSRSESCQTSQSYASCFGLPYQDHNYGAPPPPSPPRSPVPKVNGHVEVEFVPAMDELLSAKEEIVDDSITRCICGYLHDDGYMICCDKCSVWQHIDCMGIDRNNIPDNYYCELCESKPVDVERAKFIQRKKREEIDTSATDTDPDEAANHLASLNRKSISPTKGKTPKQRRISKTKEKVSPRKSGVKNGRKLPKKEKENLKDVNKLTKVTQGSIQTAVKLVRKKRNMPLSVSPMVSRKDPWNCSFSPWVDRYEEAKENRYSADLKEILSATKINGIHNDIQMDVARLRVQLCYIADVQKNRKGLLAADQISPGQIVIEFKGKVLLRQQYFEENLFFKRLHPFVLFYSKYENYDLVVDASSFGSDARFVRRSCSPNAEVHHMVERGNISFFFHAKTNILQGTEITIPFDYNYQECSFCVECACLRNNCPVSKFWKKVKNAENITSKSPVKEKKTRKPSVSNTPGKKSTVANELTDKPSTPSTPEIQTVNSVEVVSRTRKSSSTEEKVRKNSTDDRSRKSSGSSVPTKVDDSLCPNNILPSPVKQSPDIKSHVYTRASFNIINVQKKIVPKEEPVEVISPKEPLVIPKFEPLPSGANTESQANSQTEDDAESAEKAHKKTREERKMEAILKAFEKLEKREERRKEALARIGVQRKSQDGKNPDSKSDDSKSEAPKSDDKDPETPEVKENVEDKPRKTENPAPDQPPVTSSVDIKVELKPEVPPIKVYRGKKSRKHGKRRSRINSTSVLEISSAGSVDESSNSNASTPCTPLPTSAPLPMSAEVIEASGGFKFLKTKKHLFNEWKSEKISDLKPAPNCKSEPLEVKVDETVFVTCLPSPRNAMEHLPRRNSQSAGCSNPSIAHQPAQKATIEHGSGSAKKRWLRQAMFETGPTVSESDNASPMSGGASPNPHLYSPGSSPPSDIITPLKKRRLARESLSLDQPATSTPSIMSSVQSGDSTSADSVPLVADLQDLQNKNGFMPLTPIIPADFSEHNIYLSKKFRHSSGHRDSTDIESDASESLIQSSTEHSVSMDSECDMKESPIKKSSAMDVLDKQEADNNSIMKTEPDHSEDKCSRAGNVTTKDKTDGTGSDCESCLQKNGESDAVMTECRSDSVDMESKPLVSDSTECIADDELLCDSQNTACDVEQSKSDPAADNETCVSSGTVDSSLTLKGAGNSGSNEVSESCVPSEVIKSNDDEVSCGSITKDTSVQDNVCSSNNIELCSATVENANVCDSVSHIEDERTNVQCDDSLFCVSSTGEGEGDETSDATSCVHSADSINVPDSQSENFVKLACDETSADSGFENLSGVSSTCAVESVQDISQSSAASLPNFSQSVVSTETEAQSSVQSTGPITAEDTSLAPTKKKVSLLEYRKRIKEKKQDNSNSSTPVKSFSSSLGTHMNNSRIASLQPLPLFSSLPSAAEKVSRKVKRLRKEGPRKPMSLTERLRQEFGLEESEEEDKDEEPSSDKNTTVIVAPAHSAVRPTTVPLGSCIPPAGRMLPRVPIRFPIGGQMVPGGSRPPPPPPRGGLRPMVCPLGTPRTLAPSVLPSRPIMSHSVSNRPTGPRPLVPQGPARRMPLTGHRPLVAGQVRNGSSPAPVNRPLLSQPQTAPRYPGSSEQQQQQLGVVSAIQSGASQNTQYIAQVTTPHSMPQVQQFEYNHGVQSSTVQWNHTPPQQHPSSVQSSIVSGSDVYSRKPNKVYPSSSNYY
ncbi:inactive histone-lysine N-methyltransferase 2E-like isoform X2 [Gigantopelta aegis]|uniref:inactive histone-lysine N-methyltransferase 2E-like isoform X2 n=1 Tax=Gigantopelta aegis TaxID=1735272 RepID=UPI001B88BFF9|nr:inactive histone-lysine N-methyltransferase 2E-like isoform X2 [Gigantopelta aegis]